MPAPGISRVDIAVASNGARRSNPQAPRDHPRMISKGKGDRLKTNWLCLVFTDTRPAPAPRVSPHLQKVCGLADQVLVQARSESTRPHTIQVHNHIAP